MDFPVTLDRLSSRLMPLYAAFIDLDRVVSEVNVTPSKRSGFASSHAGPELVINKGVIVRSVLSEAFKNRLSFFRCVWVNTVFAIGQRQRLKESPVVKINRGIFLTPGRL